MGRQETTHREKQSRLPEVYDKTSTDRLYQDAVEFCKHRIRAENTLLDWIRSLSKEDLDTVIGACRAFLSEEVDQDAFRLLVGPIVCLVSKEQEGRTEAQYDTRLYSKQIVDSASVLLCVGKLVREEEKFGIRVDSCNLCFADGYLQFAAPMVIRFKQAACSGKWYTLLFQDIYDHDMVRIRCRLGLSAVTFVLKNGETRTLHKPRSP